MNSVIPNRQREMQNMSNILNPLIKQVLYLNGNEITKSVMLMDVRIHLEK